MHKKYFILEIDFRVSATSLGLEWRCWNITEQVYCIHRHHIKKEKWSAVTGEILLCDKPAIPKIGKLPLWNNHFFPTLASSLITFSTSLFVNGIPCNAITVELEIETQVSSHVRLWLVGLLDQPHVLMSNLPCSKIWRDWFCTGLTV